MQIMETWVFIHRRPPFCDIDCHIHLPTISRRRRKAKSSSRKGGGHDQTAGIPSWEVAGEVLTESGQTKHLKRPDNPGPDPDCPGTQKGQLSQRRAQSRSRWKDNSPLADHMRRGAACERWQSKIKQKGYEWETSKPAHVSGPVKGFV